MWPDWAIYWALCNFIKPLATIHLSKSHTFLGIFVKVSKSIIFLVKSFLGNFYWQFFSGHTDRNFFVTCKVAHEATLPKLQLALKSEINSYVRFNADVCSVAKNRQIGWWQCDHVLKSKVAQFYIICPKRIHWSFKLKSSIFQSSPKSHQIFRLLFKENL